MKIASLLFLSSLFSILSFAQGDDLDSLKKAMDSSSDKVRVTCGLQLAEKLLNAGKYDQAIIEINTASELSSKLDLKSESAKSLTLAGIYYYRKNELYKSLNSFLKSASLLTEINEEKSLGQVYNWIGNIHYAQSSYSVALDYHLKALSNRQKFNDRKGIGQSLYNIANIYSDQKDYNRALNFHFQSLKIKQELNDTKGLAFAYNNIALIYSNLKNFDTAQKYFIDALKLFEQLNIQQGVAYALGNLGEVYEKQGDIEKAVESLSKAIELLENLGDKKALAEAHNHLGILQMRLKNLSGARKHLVVSQELANEVGAKNELIENYLAFSKLDSVEGNVSKSFEWFKKHASLREDVYNIERSNEMAQLQTRFDLEKKDQQIVLLEAEKKLESNEKKNQFFIALVVVLALVLTTVSLSYTIKQKQRSNNILSAQKKYSEELNQLKDRLFSIISHDLRSPLHNISGLLSLADNNMMTEHELKEYLSKVGQSTESLSSLIDNLLYWAKSNLRNEGIKRDKFDIGKLAKKNVTLLQPQADVKSITIKNEVAANVNVFADYNMIDLVVRNLVSNAIKFTREIGVITLLTKEDNKMLTFFVKDTGIGIPHDKVVTLFNIQNTSTNGTNDEPGTGLGLILCKEFVEKNGGTITVQTVPDKGSTFSFTLPVSKS